MVGHSSGRPACNTAQPTTAIAKELSPRYLPGCLNWTSGQQSYLHELAGLLFQNSGSPLGFYNNPGHCHTETGRTFLLHRSLQLAPHIWARSIFLLPSYICPTDYLISEIHIFRVLYAAHSDLKKTTCILYAFSTWWSSPLSMRYLPLVASSQGNSRSCTK